MTVSDFLGMTGEEWLVGFIRGRLDSNLNALLIMIGPPGTGKSWSALRLASLLDARFDPTKSVVFTLEAFLSLINEGKLRPGDVVVFDESGVDLGARAAMSKINKAFQALLESSRFLRLCVIFTVPSLAFIDLTARRLAHMIVETEGILKAREMVRVKPFFVQGGPGGEEWRVYPRFHTPKGPIRLTSILIGKPPEDITTAYENARESHMRGIYKALQESLVREREGSEASPVRRVALKAPIVDAALLAHPEKSDTDIASEAGVSRPYVWERRRNLGLNRQ